MSKARETFNLIHEVGAKRHPHTWFTANHAAVAAAHATGTNPITEENKVMLSLVVLRVLDVVSPEEGIKG